MFQMNFHVTKSLESKKRIVRIVKYLLRASGSNLFFLSNSSSKIFSFEKDFSGPLLDY